MSIQWTEDMSTGAADIDAQHKELILRLNALMGACIQQQGMEEIGRYMEFLMEYVSYHFAAEEREMCASRYPALERHEQEHEQFKKDINSLHREIRAGGPRRELVRTTLWASSNWLINHVKGTDREMAKYLKKERGK
jgi:hemerythrin